jgi:integrase/recombinase XerD
VNRVTARPAALPTVPHVTHVPHTLKRLLPGTFQDQVQITAVTTMLDAGVDLRDVQIAARHADPRTTMRYDRARKNLDRHPNYILAAYMASGT